jgi:SHS2 domain-containing protein
MDETQRTGNGMTKMQNENWLEEIDHTADRGFVVRAETPESLFEKTAKAMFRTMLPDPPRAAELRTLPVVVAADTPDALLHEWLAELLYLSGTNRLYFNEFHVKIHEFRSLAATVHGQPMTDEMILASTEIKAVTWHALRLERTPAGFEASVVLDM